MRIFSYLDERGGRIARLPYSIRVLLEAVLRTCDGYVVSDPGSLNGTYVNQERIDRMLLRHGDELQIGKFRLVFFERNDA